MTLSAKNNLAGGVSNKNIFTAEVSENLFKYKVYDFEGKGRRNMDYYDRDGDYYADYKCGYCELSRNGVYQFIRGEIFVKTPHIHPILPARPQRLSVYFSK